MLFRNHVTPESPTTGEHCLLLELRAYQPLRENIHVYIFWGQLGRERDCHQLLEFFLCLLGTSNFGGILGLLLCSESPIALFSVPTASLWILSTTGNFTHSIKGKSHRLWPLMTALLLDSIGKYFDIEISLKISFLINIQVFNKHLVWRFFRVLNGWTLY